MPEGSDPIVSERDLEKQRAVKGLDLIARLVGFPVGMRGTLVISLVEKMVS